MFSGVGGAEILVILLFALIFFGPRRFAEIARTIGKAGHYLRKTISQIEDEIGSVSDDDRPPPLG